MDTPESVRKSAAALRVAKVEAEEKLAQLRTEMALLQDTIENLESWAGLLERSAARLEKDS